MNVIYTEGASMSNYNSTNTDILAMETQAGNNTRMLLAHHMDNGNMEYVIGSYFTTRHYVGSLEGDFYTYSWDWGHYFQSIFDAVDYWRSHVEDAPDYRCPECGSDNYWYEEVTGDIHELYDHMKCQECGCEYEIVLKPTETRKGWTR